MPLTLSAIILTHFGLLDGSAAIALDDKSFLVASDEINVLHSHGFADHQQAAPVFDLNMDFQSFPSKTKKKGGFKESDLEGAALVGKDVVYWIGSHSRDGDGAECKER